jgi:hypothetical protein
MLVHTHAARVRYGVTGGFARGWQGLGWRMAARNDGLLVGAAGFEPTTPSPPD